MLKRLLTQKRYFKNIYKRQKGITGLETAIILIAFVVVAAVFAYTVLSAGLFSTQKSQEAVYAGLEETQNTIDLKGATVANGSAMLNNCDYVAWTNAEVANVTIARDTVNKWEGSAAMALTTSNAGIDTGDEIAYRAMTDMTLTAGDTIEFWAKTSVANSDLWFAIGDVTDLSTLALAQRINITAADTNWHKYSKDLAGDITANYFGFYCAADNVDITVYIDNIMFDDVASQNGIPCGLDSCDYPTGFTAGANETLARVTNDKVEGTGSISCVVADAAAQNETLLVQAMEAKNFVAGDEITFWAKVPATLHGNITFAFSTSATINGNTTEVQVINPDDTVAAGLGWQKYAMTLAGDDTGATFYGVYLTTDTAGPVTFYLDDIEISNASLNNNNDPMNAFANSISFTVTLASGGDGVDFTPTVDSNHDGILSDEATKTHKVVVYYNDETQQLTDLAWTMTPIGKADGDTILDVGEKFEITVDLTYVNHNSGVWASSKIGKNKTFTLELKPPTGAVLTVQRTMPPKVLTVNNLN